MIQHTDNSRRSFLAGKRMIVLMLSIMFAGVCLAGTTFSWLTNARSKINQIDFAQMSFDLSIDLESEQGEEGEVRLRNTGEMPGFLRVMVFPSLVAEDGTTLLKADIGDEILLETNDSNWDSYWIDGKDGYFYYTNVLAPGETTSQLFEGMNTDELNSEKYDGANLTITIVGELVEIRKWYYRTAWWDWDGTMPIESELSVPRASVDAILSGLAR